MATNSLSNEQIIREIKESGAGKVKVAITDVDGILRGKYIHTDKFIGALEKGFGFCNVVFGWDAADVVYEDAGVKYTGWHTGYPDAPLKVIPDSCRELPSEGDDMLLFLAENDDGVTLLGQPPAFGLDPAAREGTRLSGPFTALWYAVFVIPFFLWVPGPARAAQPAGAVRRGLRDLAASLRALPRRRSLFAYLGASLLYRDALNGIYAFGGIYAAGVLGWSVVQIGVFGIIAAAVGALGCWLAGKLDSALGPKPVIVGGVSLLLAVCVVIVGTDRSMVVFVPVADGSRLPDAAFYVCGALIGTGGGAVQSASRTMLVRQSDPARMTEGFGLYALSGKVLAFLAPALVALATQLTDSQRAGVAPLIVLLLAGLALMAWVRPEGEPSFRAPHPS